MNLLKTFFGQILRKVDVDFALLSGRSSNVQQNIDFTDANGGVVNGLDVTKSVDARSIIITPGVFYSKGDFKNQNNLGGGERGELFSIQTFSGLPSTPPIRNNTSYLLVYAKITTQNVNPDPTKNQQITSSKNVLTGENVPTRDYAFATIVVSNPILISEVSRYNGVPLALLTVDYDLSGTQLSNNGTIQSITTIGVKQAYVIAKSVDILNNVLVDTGVPNSFITNRMLASNSIDSDKLLDNTLGSSKLAPWDGSTAYNVLTGSGVANQNMKGGAITSDKINYQLGLNGFNTRNRLPNSSFEFSVPGSGSVPTNWNITNTGTSSQVLIGGVGQGNEVKYGGLSLYMNAGGPTPTYTSVDQVIDFAEDLTGLPISPSFWSQIKTISTNASGNTFLQGSIEFLNNLSGTTSGGGPFVFGTVSGTGLGWSRYSNASPIIYSGLDHPSLIRYKIGGTFNGSYFVDGASLVMSDLLPEYDISPAEYTQLSGFLGDITSDQIGNGTIQTRHIMPAVGPPTSDPGNGITSSQIRDFSIQTNHIADSSITAIKLDPAAGLIPINAIILWTTGTSASDVNSGINPCPPGFHEATEFRGRFPLGVNPGATPGTIEQSSKDNGGLFASGSTLTVGGESGHVHQQAIGTTTSNLPSGPNTTVAIDPALNTHGSSGHTHDAKTPFETVYFCRKNA